MGCCSSSAPDPKPPTPNPLAGLGRVKARLHELGIKLGESKAVGNYNMFSQVDNVIYLSGHIPKTAETPSFKNTGKLGADVSIEDGAKCAKQCVINILSSLDVALNGDLDRIVKFVKMNVYVACTPEFTQQPVVANGASDFLVEVLGEKDGRCARAAVGKASLPLDMAVEIEAVVEVLPPAAAPAAAAVGDASAAAVAPAAAAAASGEEKK